MRSSTILQLAVLKYNATLLALSVIGFFCTWKGLEGLSEYLAGDTPTVRFWMLMLTSGPLVLLLVLWGIGCAAFHRYRALYVDGEFLRSPYFFRIKLSDVASASFGVDGGYGFNFGRGVVITRKSGKSASLPLSVVRGDEQLIRSNLSDFQTSYLGHDVRDHNP